MIGDKLHITEYHREAATLIFERLKGILKSKKGAVAVSVAGESGCGKSETAALLAKLCTDHGENALVLQQDDYFVYPPKTNHQKRLADINWVGLREVKLDQIDAHIRAIKNEAKEIIKPLIYYKEDWITEEKVVIDGVTVIIAEGTYTTTLKSIDLRTFINRNYRQTRKARLTRSRDPVTEFLETVLSIEHRIISGHKEFADIIIPPPRVERNDHF